MSKIVVAALIYSVSIFNSFAGKKEFEGRIISKNDTLNVTFLIKISRGKLLQNKDELGGFVFYKHGNSNFIKLISEKGIRIEVKEGDNKFIAFDAVKVTGMRTKYQFLRPIINGKITLYTFQYAQGSGNAYGFTNYQQGYVLRRNNFDETFYNTLGVNSALRNYFQHCPKIEKEFPKNMLKLNNIFTIVRFYNEDCD